MVFKGEDRRIGKDRRQINATILAPDRRSGKDRRRAKAKCKRDILKLPVYFMLY